jgi:lysophospholipase L1-like esterase
MKFHEANWHEWNRVFRKLQKEGDRNLHYVKGRSLFGDDNEASLDASHPSDLGFMRMAERLYPVLKKLI